MHAEKVAAEAVSEQYRGVTACVTFATINLFAHGANT